MGEQNGVHDEPALAGEIVTMGTGSLANQAVRAKQAEFSASRGRTLALVGLGVGRGGIEQGLQIPVTKAADVELAVIDSFQ